jgi:hypothetical protein
MGGYVGSATACYGSSLFESRHLSKICTKWATYAMEPKIYMKTEKIFLTSTKDYQSQRNYGNITGEHPALQSMKFFMFLSCCVQVRQVPYGNYHSYYKIYHIHVRRSNLLTATGGIAVRRLNLHPPQYLQVTMGWAKLNAILNERTAETLPYKIIYRYRYISAEKRILTLT